MTGSGITGSGMTGSGRFEPMRDWGHTVWRWLDGPPRAHGYWRTRFVILRSLGAVYAVAFATAVFQLVPLVGEHGLLPVSTFLERVEDLHGPSAYRELPTLFWIDPSDSMLMAVSLGGLALSIAVTLGLTHAAAMFVLWVLYMSIVHVGQRWYAFGWESQLLETGFLAVFLCPLTTLRPFPRTHPPPIVVIWLMRWLVFRIMIGAGLIKLRGDPCWAALTCLDTFFETQPIPSPASWFLHHAPAWMHRGGVLFNHFAELVVPWLLFGPRRPRIFAGVVLVAFQGMLILSGNLSFLNWLTIVPCLAAFDDEFLQRFVPRAWRTQRDPEAKPTWAVRMTTWALAAAIAWMSIPVVKNILDVEGQVMNRSFDPLHLVNTYGAFGSVGRTRPELIIEGSNDGNHWEAYEFPCKPGDPERRPCLITPYHYRLDWLLWFAALEAERRHSLEREAWVLRLVVKLLQGDPGTLRLVAQPPFSRDPPVWIRVRLFQYRFADAEEDGWWTRREVGTLIRPVSIDDPDLAAALRRHGFGQAEAARAR